MTLTAVSKLFIAADRAQMRQTLRVLLSPMASEIRETADGAEAVRLFVEQQPGWLIMDLHDETGHRPRGLARNSSPLPRRADRHRHAKNINPNKPNTAKP